MTDNRFEELYQELVNKHYQLEKEIRDVDKEIASRIAEKNALQDEQMFILSTLRKYGKLVFEHFELKPIEADKGEE